MNVDLESHIRQNHTWQKLPANIKQTLGNSQREYEKAVVSFSVKNQLRYKGNLVKTIKKDEKRYYEELVQYSREHLMLYPYHLSDVVVKGLRITPFTYYVNMMQDIMTQERSYDSLPNFTAADCLRLLGIGRNQYIDLMNQCRSSKKFFRRKPIRDLLPAQPIEAASIEHWWIINIGYVTEDDIKLCSVPEKAKIDSIIDKGPQPAGEVDKNLVLSLYRKGLIYMDVPVADDDCVIVPPLEGFVMNRVLGDYFETLLYKIFVSIDEHTTVAELASVLQIDLQLVKHAVSMYCRLGIARKKGTDVCPPDLHPTWKADFSSSKGAGISRKSSQEHMLIDLSDATRVDLMTNSDHQSSTSPANPSLNTHSADLESAMDLTSQTPGMGKRIAFMFDSTLTAFLMMGNLSPGLKSHAVTMFEVGKLSDESMDSFLTELEKVGSDAEGEARRYFDHALTLRDTIRFLRHNKSLCDELDLGSGMGIDLLRCESLLGLEPETRSRVLNKNYSLLVSMAPLSHEIRPVSSCLPPHIGPVIPEVNSLWFKLFVYHLTGSGPPSLLLVKGTKIRVLPPVFQNYDRLLVTTWGHDPAVISTSNILLTLNDALSHSAVFIQGHGHYSEGLISHVTFPFDTESGKGSGLQSHPAVQKLSQAVDLVHTCGYITLLNPSQNGALDAESPELDPPPPPPPFQAPSPPLSSPPETPGGRQPTNGIKDQASADMLATELDELEGLTGGGGSAPLGGLGGGDARGSGRGEKGKLTLDLPDGGREGLVGVGAGGEGQEEEWVLLDCCFGIPLFNPSLNQEVCQHVASRGLFKQSSLQALLQSGRLLTLQVLDFISKWQEASVVNEMEISGIPQNREEHCAIYPTQCLLFCQGSLNLWHPH